MRKIEINSESTTASILAILFCNPDFNTFDKELDEFCEKNRVYDSRLCRIVDNLLNYIEFGQARLFDKEPLIVSLKYIFEHKETLKQKIEFYFAEEEI
jgi:hypothetical protein